MKSKSILVIGLFILGATAQADMGMATSCANCHGQQGISANDAWPNLAGQKKTYLANQLKAFRSGERKNAFMNPIATALTDDEIESLASFYAGLPRF